MPLIKLEEIGHQAAWAMWEIKEELPQLKDQILPEYDRLDELSKIHHKEKRQEWLASRLAAQSLLQHFNTPFRGIFKDNHGKPHFVDSPYHLSLAHSFPYAVAIIDRQNAVGIDIERPRPKLKRIAPKFLNSDEAKSANQDLIKLCWYWAAKETLYKIYGRKKLIFSENIAIDHFDPEIDKILTGRVIINRKNTEYRLKIYTYQGFFICHNC